MSHISSIDGAAQRSSVQHLGIASSRFTAGEKGPNLIGTPMVKATLLSVVTADETLIRVLTGVFTPPDSVHIKPRLDVAGAAAMGVARRNGQPTASPVRCHQQSSII
ncbi:MAG: hypothetical protein ACJAVR_000186 [Paracoccaceae bacterium]|jgi:hypothetical protein